MEFKDWAMMEPMKYYDKGSEGLSENLKAKRDAMILNENNQFIATQKWDGEWTMFIKWNGQYLIRSRSLSKVTGEYGDKTLHLPHLVEEMKLWPDNTVILGEVCWPQMGKVSTDVGTILRCLPAKAVERQREQKLIVQCFDCLALDGEELLNTKFEIRFAYLLSLIPLMDGKYFDVTQFCPDTMTPAEFADNIIANGGEGVVIQRRDALYQPGKRPAWQTLKLKQKLPEMELKVVKSIPANKEYNGKYPETWPYWEGEGENRMPVSKPYYYGWHMGVTVDFNGTMVDVSSGLTDEDREWLASDEAQNLIADGYLYATIKSMMVASLGGLRHPRIVRLRAMDDAMLEK